MLLTKQAALLGSLRNALILYHKAQLEKMGELAAPIVLMDQEPPLSHELASLAALAGIKLTPLLLGLQPFAVKARYSAEDTPLPGDRIDLLREIEALSNSLEARLAP
jgi:hypothetical protein